MAPTPSLRRVRSTWTSAACLRIRCAGVLRRTSRDGGGELDQSIEAIFAPVTQPIMPNFHTAEALKKFRAFRRHQQFTAARARRTPEVPFVQVIHGHTDLERHDESLRARIRNLVPILCVILGMAVSTNRERCPVHLLHFRRARHRRHGTTTKLPADRARRSKTVHGGGRDGARRCVAQSGLPAARVWQLCRTPLLIAVTAARCRTWRRVATPTP